mgnify:CR=1 FL=1
MNNNYKSVIDTFNLVNIANIKDIEEFDKIKKLFNDYNKIEKTLTICNKNNKILDYVKETDFGYLDETSSLKISCEYSRNKNLIFFIKKIPDKIITLHFEAYCSDYYCHNNIYFFFNNINNKLENLLISNNKSSTCDINYIPNSVQNMQINCTYYSTNFVNSIKCLCILNINPIEKYPSKTKFLLFKNITDIKMLKRKKSPFIKEKYNFITKMKKLKYLSIGDLSEVNYEKYITKKVNILCLINFYKHYKYIYNCDTLIANIGTHFNIKHNFNIFHKNIKNIMLFNNGFNYSFLENMILPMDLNSLFVYCDKIDCKQVNNIKTNGFPKKVKYFECVDCNVKFNNKQSKSDIVFINNNYSESLDNSFTDKNTNIIIIYYDDKFYFYYNKPLITKKNTIKKQKKILLNIFDVNKEISFCLENNN